MILKIRFFFQALYYIWRYGNDGAEKKLKAEIKVMNKETRLAEKEIRKALNESKGGVMWRKTSQLTKQRHRF